MIDFTPVALPFSSACNKYLIPQSDRDLRLPAVKDRPVRQSAEQR